MRITSSKEILIPFNKEYRSGRASIKIFAENLDFVSQKNENKIVLDLTEYKSIHPCLAVLLFSMMHIGSENNNIVVIRYLKKSKGHEFLKNCGVLDSIRKNTLSLKSIRFTKISSAEEDKTTAIIKKILATAPVDITEQLTSYLESYITEVFNNSFEHGGGHYSFCCGFHKNGQFTFSIYDTGVGIPQNVRAHLKKDISDTECIEWAIINGNSTARSHAPRGSGFSFLEGFTRLNRGNMIISSGDSVLMVKNNKKTIYPIGKRLKGTLFSMTIKTDKNGIYGVKE